MQTAIDRVEGSDGCHDDRRAAELQERWPIETGSMLLALAQHYTHIYSCTNI